LLTHLSLCPVKSTVPIEANGYIPLADSDIANIPTIAYSIPDFEGQVILRIFANSTQEEIGCYSAIVKNGASFSQPAAVGSVLGIFTCIAMIASFATAIYGDNVPTMRKHYAHSLSVGVVFAVFHHIFYTGALSMNWPSVLVAWWSNFAWAGGMIYTNSMQDSIAKFVGKNAGNTAKLGAAGAGTDASGVGGGYDIHKIYKRLETSDIVRDLHSRTFEGILAKRDLANASTGYKWYGQHVRAGLPLPGNFSGFAGTLAEENIPASSAFMTGFLWLLVLLAIVAGFVVCCKLIADVLVKRKVVKTNRLDYFRTHWKGYTVLALLRTCFIAFFVMMFLTIFQFTYDASPGPVAIAAIVFVVFLVGMFGLAGYALWFRLRHGTWTSKQDKVAMKPKKVLKVIPWVSFERNSNPNTDSEQKPTGGLPAWRLSHKDPNKISIHEDEEYIKKFGWLASRFRRTRWWFFGAWLGYEFLRAIFYAGASGHAMVQVFALLVIEFLAFLAIIRIKPFEGQRLNLIMVYLLGFSKVVTVALSAAFDIDFNLPRITTTAIGIVIIVIQGLLTIVLLVAIVLSAISSYMSITRNHEDFRPRRWIPLREKYFSHLDQAVTDLPPPPKPPTPEPEEPKGPYFSVNSVKRVAKIEDEDPEFQADIASDPRVGSQISVDRPPTEYYAPVNRGSRAVSIGSQMSFTGLPYGARVHRGSWSTREFMDYQDGHDRRSTAGGTVDSSAPLVPSPPEAYVNPQSLKQYPSTESLQSQRVYQIPTRSGSAANSKAGSPTVSRTASTVDLKSTGVDRARSSSPVASGLRGLMRPQTPPNMRTPSPLHNVSNRSSPTDSAARSSPIARGRSKGSKRLSHRPRDSIDEEALEALEMK
jgi:Transient receptor potential (TRP) ion channel/ML-like domain